MKINIITCHRAFNYGAVLQTYALQKYLKDNNYDVQVIDYVPKYIEKRKSQNKNIILRIVRPLLRFYDFKKSNKVFTKFLIDNIDLTTKYATYEQLEKNTPEAEVYIAGSDQIWNCDLENGKDDAYFLKFVKDDKKKISYAASIAMDEIPEKEKDRFKKLLKRFNFISVREQTGVKLLNEINIKNVEKVLDPVYLLEKKQWDELAKRSKLDLEKEKYVLAYGFKRQKDLFSYARELADKKGYKLYSINTNFEDFLLNVDKYYYNATPYDFINLIKNAQDVVTNSFHGLSFSIIYNKKVHQFRKNSKDNSRMLDLLDEVKLSNRLVKGAILEDEINYEDTNKKIKEERKKSIDFLKKSLGE